jgi:diguanylate cyclase (GGDEF)-like protein
VVLYSFSFYLLATVLVLSFQQASGLFLVAVIIMAALLTLNLLCAELFLTLILINVGAFLISRKIAYDFIQTATNEIETLNRLKIEATTDCLTQLLNRNGLEQALETALAYCIRDKKRIGFLMVDIDYFKNYNDTLGHLKGDKILQQVAGCINTCCKRKTDIISRIGGEEFLIFLSDVDDDHILKIAQAISVGVTNLKIRTVTENNPFEFLSVSIGIATSTPKVHDLIIDLYNQVDEALYHAKRNGRNCICFNGNIIRNPIELKENYAFLSSEKEVNLDSLI